MAVARGHTNAKLKHALLSFVQQRSTHRVRDEQMHLSRVLHHILLQSRRDELTVDLRGIDLAIRCLALESTFVRTADVRT